MNTGFDGEVNLTDIDNNAEITLAPIYENNQNILSISGEVKSNFLTDTNTKISTEYNNIVNVNQKINYITTNNLTTNNYINSFNDTYTTIKQNITNKTKQIIKNNILNLLYPIGSLYMTTSENPNTYPEVVFGGVWEQIIDKFLFCVDHNLSSGELGGYFTHTHVLPGHSLLVNELPIHNHSINITLHDNAHIHTIPKTGNPDTATGSGLINEESMSSPPTGYTSTVGNHTHTVSGTTDYTGSGSAHTHKLTEASNLPPYYSILCWIRIA